MQLLAGVKLCTGRPITNHPHFEDKWLRQRTIKVIYGVFFCILVNMYMLIKFQLCFHSVYFKVYQVYSQQPPEYVYDIMHEVNASYIILENSICFSPDQNHCHLIDILDLHNGHVCHIGCILIYCHCLAVFKIGVCVEIFTKTWNLTLLLRSGLNEV